MDVPEIWAGLQHWCTHWPFSGFWPSSWSIHSVLEYGSKFTWMRNRGNVECVAFWLRLPLFWEDFRSWNGRYEQVDMGKSPYHREFQLSGGHRPKAWAVGLGTGSSLCSVPAAPAHGSWKALLQLSGWTQLAQGFKPMQWNISYARNLSAKCNQLRSMRPSKALTLQLRQTNSGLTNTVDFASTKCHFPWAFILSHKSRYKGKRKY